MAAGEARIPVVQEVRRGDHLGASLYELPPGQRTFPYHYELGNVRTLGNDTDHVRINLLSGATGHVRTTWIRAAHRRIRCLPRARASLRAVIEHVARTSSCR